MTFMGYIHKLVKNRTDKGKSVNVTVAIKENGDATATVVGGMTSDSIILSRGLLIHDTMFTGSDEVIKKTTRTDVDLTF